MTEVIGVADAKRRFSELIDRIGGGERFVIARRGRPVAALVPPNEADRGPREAPVGLGAFAGILAEWPEFEQVMRDVVAARSQALDRPAPRLE